MSYNALPVNSPRKKYDKNYPSNHQLKVKNILNVQKGFFFTIMLNFTNFNEI